MKILVIGGRAFLGRAILESLSSRDHVVTLFNRGQTNADLYSHLELIQGDRNKDFARLSGRKWDAVIDTCGYFPDSVGQLAEVLARCVEHYVFISSCSVYDQSSMSKIADESASLVDLKVDRNDSGWATYGARKYLCELEIEKYFRGRATFIRPGLIVGPYDSTYRFPYWADRISDGGQVLTPGRYDSPTQFIDVRDLAGWICLVCENQVAGTFNATGPSEAITLGQFLDEVVRLVNPSADLVWVPEWFLRERNVACWTQLPLWVYEEIESFLRRDSSKAEKQGLKSRPIRDTILDTFKWSRSLSASELKQAALSRQVEHEILAAWRSMQKSET